MQFIKNKKNLRRDKSVMEDFN